MTAALLYSNRNSMQFSPTPRMRDSGLGALINGAINGIIAWGTFKNEAAIPLSMDSIGTPGVTAFGNAATLIFFLTFIITCVTFFVYRWSARRSHIAPEALRSMHFLPGGISIAASNTLLLFGGFVTAAVLWQRFIGTVLVSPIVASLVLAVTAIVATALAERRTKLAMIDRAQRMNNQATETSVL